MSVDGVVQCDESGDNTAIVEQSSELNSVIQSQQNSAQVLNSAQLLTVPEPTTQVLSDPVLTNIPRPVSKPADRLVPLDLQPFVRYSAVVMSLWLLHVLYWFTNELNERIIYYQPYIV